MAFNHYGLVRTIQVYDEIRKQLDNMQRHLDTINADTTWANVCVVWGGHNFSSNYACLL